METKISFKMPDNLILKGVLKGNFTSNTLVVMLHSGGYDYHERGVKSVEPKEYYNQEGNYDYLCNVLGEDVAILCYDARNHGQSGKNIDIPKMKEALTKQGFSKDAIDKMISSLLSRENIPDGIDLLKRPYLKDMSFLQMKDDLKEVLRQVKSSYNFTNIHLVGTCMGGLVSTLYTIENPNEVKSLTLFSPLFTLDSSFLKPDNEFALKKQNTISEGKQFRIGNAVEGPSTTAEIANIRKDFYKSLMQLDVPIFCIQGIEDKLVLEKHQSAIFESLERYHESHNLARVYYATIYPGVHCLYDTIFPAIVESSTFILSNISKNKSL